MSIRTNCEQFADRGDAMDARVRLDFGLTNEPARFVGRIQPDGSVAWRESREFISWNELPEPRPYVKPRVKPVQGSPESVAEGRLKFNARKRAKGRVREHNPEAGHITLLEHDDRIYVVAEEREPFPAPKPLISDEEIDAANKKHAAWLAEQAAERARYLAWKAARGA